jgi:hypothetical protein
MQLMGLKRLPRNLYKGSYCRQNGFKTISLPQQTTYIVMEGVEVKSHLQKGYEEEGHKCVEVAMVEEPQHCFS